VAEQPVDPATLGEALERATGAVMRPGNRLDLVQNGAVFDTLEQEIRRARASVHIVTFIWRGEGGPSARIGRALLARRPGVICRIAIDSFGSLKFSRALERRLEASGCEIHRSGSLVMQPFRRDHRKIVVVDGRVGVTGGFGIWNAWDDGGDGKGRPEWRESSVRVEGPVVADMQRAFEQSWIRAGGAPLQADSFPDLPAAGKVPAAFVASAPRLGDEGASPAEAMTHLVARAARQQLWIANSYFIPDRSLQRLLVERRRLGVDVRVLAAGPVHDLPIVRAAQRQTYETLLPGDVRIWEYQPTMMHSKTMVVDGRIAVVGSTNMDALSFDTTDEGSLVADSPEIAAQLTRLFLRDCDQALEITADDWEDREALPELGRELAGQLRQFL
jgi:cardiolipin synthase